MNSGRGTERGSEGREGKERLTRRQLKRPIETRGVEQGGEEFGLAAVVADDLLRDAVGGGGEGQEGGEGGDTHFGGGFCDLEGWQ